MRGRPWTTPDRTGGPIDDVCGLPQGRRSAQSPPLLRHAAYPPGRASSGCSSPWATPRQLSRWTPT